MDGPRRTILLDLVEEIADSLAARLAILLRRPAAAPVVRRFAGELAAARPAPDDPAPWVAACFGLADPRRCAPVAFRRAEKFLAGLRALPPASRREAVRRARRQTRNPALAELLVEEARRRLGADPRRALAWLDLGEEAARRLPARFPAIVGRRLRGRLSAHRANALRVMGELAAAARIFDRLAALPPAHRPPRPEDRAELWSLEASLRIDLREWEEAERLLAEAGQVFEATGDGVGAAKVLLKRGTAAEYSGRSETALALYQEAAETIDAEAEPALFLLSRMNAANALVDLGRPAEARALLATHRELPERHGDPPTRLRWRWTGARVDRAEERFTEAEAGFNEVANGLLALRRPYDAALALLDTAELFLAQGAWGKVKGLAERLEAVFEARGVHLETRKALILFQQAARAERLTAEWLARLRRYLLVARNDRELRFEARRTGGSARRPQARASASRRRAK